MKTSRPIRIDERLPEGPLQAEVVLHVRRHLRHRLRAGVHADHHQLAADLALLFGRPAGDDALLRRATRAGTPIAEAAVVLADGALAVALGHDAAHVERCRTWLLDRKDQDGVFRQIVATDLATLLALSQARDLSGAPEAPDAQPMPVLITGETGTGKELLAFAMHSLDSQAARRERPWVPVQVAGMPIDLISSELFGHTKGAFTGAGKDRPGRMEESNGGTLLIDEVGDLPPEAQVRLLRFLQDQRFSRMGEARIREVKARVLAATLHDLDTLVASGKFRIDLLHRLRVGRLGLPALRDREGFWGAALDNMLQKVGQRAEPSLTRAARDALAAYAWPGNLRELHGVLRLALRSAMGGTIRLEDLPGEIQRPYLARPLHERAPGFLCDEVEDQRLTPDLISWRISEVARQLDAGTPLPAVDEMPDRLALSLRQIPDSDPKHKALVASLDALLELDRHHQRLMRLGNAWESIADALDGPVATVARDQLVALREQAEGLARKAEQHRGAIDLNASPWFRLWRELMEHPFGRKDDPTRLLGHIVGLAEFLHGISPDWFQSLHTIIEEGGIRLLVSKLWELLKANADGHAVFEQEADPDEVLLDHVREILGRPHKTWSREEWALLVAAYPTRAALARDATIDPKTISKHLKTHGLEEAWGILQQESA